MDMPTTRESVSRRLATLLAVLAAALVAGSLLVAPPASAYPPGTTIKASTTKSSYKPKAKVSAKAQNVRPGCRVLFQVFTNGNKPLKGKKYRKTTIAGSDAAAKAKIKAPSSKGKYKIRTTDLCTKLSSQTKIKVK